MFSCSNRYQKSAKLGFATAQFNLGVMYENGLGVVQDYAEAVRWFLLAAEQGNARAQSNVGTMYGNGDGVAQDYAEAMRWFRLAAEQGNARAQSNVGMMFDNGDGVAQDYVLAHMWYNIAAANGDNKAADARENVASRMTTADISEAQRRARVCMDSDYTDCD